MTSDYHTDAAGAIALPATLHDIVTEYETKVADIPAAIEAFQAAGNALQMASRVRGEWGNVSIDTGRTDARAMELSLRRSAWQVVWNRLQLPTIATAADKRRFEMTMADPPPCDMDTIRATFGPYVENPRASILRGLAEVFSTIDPAYKSHEKVKIGVKGLPKRVIITGMASWYGGGKDKLRDVLNALAAYQGLPLVDHAELNALEKDGSLINEGGEIPHPFDKNRSLTVPARGVWLKRFQNGNGHLFFGPAALLDINRALAEFYGDVLPDSPEAQAEKRASTDVARDLQYYPTPPDVIERMLDGAHPLKGARVLEPSCGDGNIMDAVRAAGAMVLGIEVDAGRAKQAQESGHVVHCANFLECQPDVPRWRDFDFVLMNPPFFGRHYAKHVHHAMKFLKPGGVLIAVLPSTARYDHGLLDDLHPRWQDLPVGAFASSGTNVCTSIATIRRAA